ncbi:type II secretion system F family protein [Streptomonospora nanhaiensis]|uniref:Type II secretion system F family protein n=1 Tax=Streptomonospora nanhaiensis TaxID=1323731 RepID=A0ABY6YHV0_9ACTN|nr:type II secretion system F family protein [Streptomonospora nanhaiensis]WAE71761.1 type II secretion system F family protein [Streptomonospora nanhaiensis]
MTPTLAAVLAGAALGLALWALLAARWARPTLAERLAAPPPPRQDVAAGPDTGVLARLGGIGAPVLEGFGMPGPRTRRNLRVCERSPASYLAEKFTALVLGIAFPPLLGGLLSLAGVLPSGALAMAMWAAFAVIVWFAPDMSLRDEADKRRERMRRALAGFADLVVVSLAGGAGVNGALADAGAAGNGWAMARIRESLREAALMRQSPWTALRDLGERYDTPEFAELAASLQLAGADGARIRSSLAAKAKTLRTQFLSEMDAEAQSATERMSLPVVLLFAGFLALLGYPAMSHILFS